jgi:hypothetical protein
MKPIRSCITPVASVSGKKSRPSGLSANAPTRYRSLDRRRRSGADTANQDDRCRHRLCWQPKPTTPTSTRRWQEYLPLERINAFAAIHRAAAMMAQSTK